MAEDSTLKSRVIAAAMRLAAERPWTDITLRDIAGSANTTLADIKDTFASKDEVLAAFVDMIDGEVLRRAPANDTSGSKRDAVFEIVMSRFDALAPYKAALRSILDARAIGPDMLKAQLRSQHWMLAAAGIDTSGPKGAIRIAGLSSVYAAVFRIWLEDDDPGLARTMAALDRRLRSGERTMTTVEDVMGGLERIGRMFKPKRTGNAGAAPSAPPEPPADAPPFEPNCPSPAA